MSDVNTPNTAPDPRGGGKYSSLGDEDEEWTDEELEALGVRLQEVVQSTVEETGDLSVEQAAARLQARLDEIEEVSFDREWATEVVEALRRGDDVTIELG